MCSPETIDFTPRKKGNKLLRLLLSREEAEKIAAELNNALKNKESRGFAMGIIGA